MAAFPVTSTSEVSFFDNKEIPKLPVTPGSTFGIFGNTSCFSFGQPNAASKDKKIFTFGCNPQKTSDSNFEVKMEELRQSFTSINNQPLSIGLPKNSSISERTRKIASLENALNEIQSLKEKVCSVEYNIARLLTEELDSMKENLAGVIHQNPPASARSSISGPLAPSAGYQQPSLFCIESAQMNLAKSKPKLFSNFKAKPLSSSVNVFGAAVLGATGVTSEDKGETGNSSANPVKKDEDGEEDKF